MENAHKLFISLMDTHIPIDFVISFHNIIKKSVSLDLLNLQDILFGVKSKILSTRLFQYLLKQRKINQKVKSRHVHFKEFLDFTFIVHNVVNSKI
jgi:hypothetical protein